MKKILLGIIISSIFLYGSDNKCAKALGEAKQTDQAACIKATECFKNDTRNLLSSVEGIKAISKELNAQMMAYVAGTAECENNKAYARKAPNSLRWKTLAEECAKYYYETGNVLVSAKRNLNQLNKHGTVDLEDEISASEASLRFIKIKCNP